MKKRLFTIILFIRQVWQWFILRIYRQGSHIMRFGYQAPIVQNLTQNLVHKIINNNYYLNYDIHHNRFSYFGAYNPYTPWTY